LLLKIKFLKNIWRKGPSKGPIQELYIVPKYVESPDKQWFTIILVLKIASMNSNKHLMNRHL
jgi:hypothetical protein